MTEDLNRGTLRTVRTFVLRAGRMTDAQKKHYNELMPTYGIHYEKKRLNFEEIFENTNPVIVEIGFGNGAATAQMALKNPDYNYLGIEVFKAGVGKLLGRILEHNIPNIRIIEHDAIEVLSDMIADNSLSGIHTFFPDPWHKKRHAKRRLIHRPRTDLLVSKLKKDGYLYFATDIEDYAIDAREQLENTPFLTVAPPENREGIPWRPITKFETKARQQGRPTVEIFSRKL